MSSEENSKARKHYITSYTLARREFAIVLLLSENDRIFAKTDKTPFLAVRAHFSAF